MTFLLKHKPNINTMQKINFLDLYDLTAGYTHL